MKIAVINFSGNVEDLMGQMQRYRGSHEDFDGFVVPTVPRLKQQMDTIATLVELNRIGVPAVRLTLVFNMIEDGVTVAQSFDRLLTFLKQQPIAQANPRCCLGANGIYARLKGTKTDLATSARRSFIRPPPLTSAYPPSPKKPWRSRPPTSSAVPTRSLQRPWTPRFWLCSTRLVVAIWVR
ncbi:MAG: hypothetical protein Q8K50_15320 [Hydrogenophaga sp.]|nr:hypothetical protein [Hydrogenophaga sp.]MDP2095239.1 hypothetical protein [Hydrogenophaga sp.]